MQKLPSNVKGILSSAALAAAVTIALGWPSHVNAVGSEEQAAQQQAAIARLEAAPENAELAQNEYKIGDLDVTASLEPSQENPGRQVIRLECKNPTEGRIEGVIQVALTRTSGSGGERVMPIPKIAWRHNENVAVEPGATLIREVSMPKNITAEVARIERLQKAASESDSVRYPNVYFGATADAIEPPTRVAAKTKAPKRANQLAVAPVAPLMAASPALAPAPIPTMPKPAAPPRAQAASSAPKQVTTVRVTPVADSRTLPSPLAMGQSKLTASLSNRNRNFGY